VRRVLESFERLTLENFSDRFYDPSYPLLPYDHADFLQQDTEKLLTEYFNLCKQFGVTPSISRPISNEPSALRAYRERIERQLMPLREGQFYKLQSTRNQINDILEFWDNIKNKSLLGGEAYLPAYYEWVVWRIFLAINTIINTISDTRNFDIDEDLQPTGHAQSGKPDMIFHYDDFVIVCEATLATGNAQWEREYASVPRHVEDIMRSTNKEVYGIFISPEITENMVLQFFTQARRNERGERISLNIVPIEMNILIGILSLCCQGEFNANSLRTLLEEIIQLKTEAKDDQDWNILRKRKMAAFVRRDGLPILFPEDE